MRMVRLNGPFGAGSQLASLSGGTIVLEIEIERSVCVILERHPTHSKPIERVCNLEAFGVGCFLEIEAENVESLLKVSESLLTL
jgi:hypothetical protein